jgi:microcystin-dependent protein
MKLLRNWSLVLGTVLTTVLLFAAVSLVVPPPKRAQAQLGGVQTWAGQAGGSVNAITLTIHNVGALGDLLGVPIRFLSGTVGSNTGPTNITINLDSGGTLGPVVLKRPTSNLGIQLLSGNELGTNNITEVLYDGTEFVITSPIDMTPIGTAVDYRAGSAQRGYLIEDGSCVSQTTYAALFTVIGTTYGGGCGGGLFPVPDSRGTSSIALDGQGANGLANRITSATCTAPNSLTATVCGVQASGIGTGNLPASPLSVSTSGSVSGTTSGYSPTAGGAGAFAIGGTPAAASFTPTGGNLVYQSNQFAAIAGFSSLTVSASGSMSGTTANMGSGTALVVLNPMLRVTRMIKF